jgi:hypothetical protein
VRDDVLDALEVLHDRADLADSRAKVSRARVRSSPPAERSTVALAAARRVVLGHADLERRLAGLVPLPQRVEGEPVGRLGDAEEGGGQADEPRALLISGRRRR